MGQQPLGENIRDAIKSIKGGERTLGESIKQMRERHKAEIKNLEDNCKHVESEWMPYMWAPGHYGSDARVCDYCGKILERKPICDSASTAVTDTTDYTD